MRRRRARQCASTQNADARRAAQSASRSVSRPGALSMRGERQPRLSRPDAPSGVKSSSWSPADRRSRSRAAKRALAQSSVPVPSVSGEHDRGCVATNACSRSTGSAAGPDRSGVAHRSCEADRSRAGANATFDRKSGPLRGRGAVLASGVRDLQHELAEVLAAEQLEQRLRGRCSMPATTSSRLFIRPVLQVARQLGDRAPGSARRSRTRPCLPCARG